ncbi:hypothetical protein NP511_10655 [Natrinema thermotolerans]|uniref:Uncharacterized protein n=1 Tax=Natrinema thermotolerans TaxID=121872 RepID=A0AAF0T459_9EURY|nr:hypothetical protein [Natrinema thermotolerans]WMT10067.1 hypothetical protein NP511_10655 [Natrinema thermotolerans]
MGALPRRKLLAVSGTALTGTVAGCMGGDDGDDGNGDGSGDGGTDDPADGETESETVDGTILGEITVDNLDGDAHTVDIIVEFDREIEDWATEELEAGGGTTLDRNWPTESGQFRVTTRLDQGEPVEVTPADWNDPSCLNLFVRIDRNGELTLLSDTTSGPCGAGDPSVDDTDT